MKKKEKKIEKGHFYKYGTIYVILLVVALFVLFYFSRVDKFNPDEDVCEEWELAISCSNDCCSYSNEWYEKCDKVEKICNAEEPKDCSCECYDCLNWRPKTLCEKCIDNRDESCDKDCECDEQEIVGYNWGDCIKEVKYGYDNKTIVYESRGTYMGVSKEEANRLSQLWECEWHSPDYICVKASLKPTPIKINLEKEKCDKWTNETIHPKGSAFKCSEIFQQINIWKETKYNHITEGWQNKYNKYCCLKKIKKNNCEMEDDDWVWSNISYEKECSSMQVDCIKYINCKEVSGDHPKIKKAFEEYKQTNKIPDNAECNEWVDKVIELDYKICRKKLLPDLNCFELEEYYIYHSAGISSDCNTNNKDGFVTCANNQRYPWVERSGEILFEYLERCGGKE